MPITLDDSTLSVWQLVERIQQKSMNIAQRRTMNIISYEIENMTLLEGAKNRIFSSFQSMSKFIPQVKRYTQLAQKAEKIYVFGIPDVAVPEIENIEYVYISEHHSLAREWFIVSTGERYASALVTQELSRGSALDHLRKFRGLWTFDLTMISIVDEWLSNTVKQSSFENLAKPLPNLQAQKTQLTRTIEHIDVLIQQKPPEIQTELQQIRQTATQELLQIQV